jgi:hypothetical protein
MFQSRAADATQRIAGSTDHPGIRGRPVRTPTGAPGRVTASMEKGGFAQLCESVIDRRVAGR